MTEDEEHTAIVDQLRRAGMGRREAVEEADELMAERIKRRFIERNKPHEHQRKP